METVINKRNNINPQLFALWVGMASMVMFFGAFTSAFIVKQAAGNWLEFPIPSHFYISSAVIVLSSITLHISYWGYKNQKETLYKGLLVTTFILGVTFLVLQYNGWQALYSLGIDFKANVSGSFFYLITGAHALHILGGLAALFVACYHAFSLKFQYKEKRKNRFELVVYYWHFVDILWLYLFFFLLTTK